MLKKPYKSIVNFVYADRWSTKNMINKLKKLFCILLTRDKKLLRALRYSVGASIEHSSVLKHLRCHTVVDIGANRGQFALVARYCFPRAKIISFEPLPDPASIFEKVFCNYDDVILHNVAIGPISGQSIMHVSARDDSSSLLPISTLQEKIFPGTGEIGEVLVRTASLNECISEEDIVSPALLKLDVQGFEYDCLRGCESLLHKFEWVYCECSFVELYSGQKLAADVIAWLADKGFYIKGIYNTAYDSKGLAIQADFLFQCNAMDRASCG